jgi:4-amino-4-deoxy-L-arabinose transferase-like glycosyltransferase
MINRSTFHWLLFFCFLGWLAGFFAVPLMDIDASQYASISREMLERKSFLQVYDVGKDYLDKPPLLFWISALSMWLFGVSEWAFRFPPLLFAILSVVATYQLARLFYNQQIARLSAIVLASSQALFLITHDVRCDTMLMGWVTLSLWQLADWYQTNRKRGLLIATLAIAGGMLTKGPIALLVPAFAFAPHFILRREWKPFFKVEYLGVILGVGLLLIPMCVGLYLQYDLQPGKLINGIPIQSGLRFYFWTQSFGRFTGENFFHEMSYFSFLFENMLWSFLPWIVLFSIGLVWSVYQLAMQKFTISAGQEWIAPGGFIVTYLVLSRSQYQLPHYIFVVFPLAAIVTAHFIFQLLHTPGYLKFSRWVTAFHSMLYAVLWIVLIGLLYWAFPTLPFWVKVLSVIGLVVYIVLLFIWRKSPLLLMLAVYTSVGVNIFLSTAFYPNVLQYQMGNDAANFIQSAQLPKEKIMIFGPDAGRSLYFYSEHIFPNTHDWKKLPPGSLVITVMDSVPVLQQHYPGLQVLHKGNNYGVSMLTPAFLNPATREASCGKYAIIQLSPKP